MKKYACYCMTRNLYHKLWISLNSLLEHSDVDKVFLLTEDDEVPLENISFFTDEKIQIVNVSKQPYFRPDGPNYKTQWTWMLLMRTALAKVLPDVDKILALDLDTEIVENINEIWDMPIDDYYLAACPEPGKSDDSIVYINGGVVLWNLKKMRDGKCDEIISSLNNKTWLFPDQSVISYLCKDKIYYLHSMYNACPYTKPTSSKKIIHFAATRNWYESHPLVKGIYGEVNNG